MLYLACSQDGQRRPSPVLVGPKLMLRLSREVIPAVGRQDHRVNGSMGEIKIGAPAGREENLTRNRSVQPPAKACAADSIVRNSAETTARRIS